MYLICVFMDVLQEVRMQLHMYHVINHDLQFQFTDLTKITLSVVFLGPQQAHPLSMIPVVYVTLLRGTFLLKKKSAYSHFQIEQLVLLHSLNYNLISCITNTARNQLAASEIEPHCIHPHSYIHLSTISYLAFRCIEAF